MDLTQRCFFLTIRIIPVRLYAGRQPALPAACFFKPSGSFLSGLKSSNKKFKKGTRY
jgi:hypothetical protein